MSELNYKCPDNALQIPILSESSLSLSQQLLFSLFYHFCQNEKQIKKAKFCQKWKAECKNLSKSKKKRLNSSSILISCLN